MGLAYLKTFHGILSLLQIFLGLIALLAGYLLWDDTNNELYWLFYMGQRPLATVVLIILSLCWFYGLGILFQQLFVTDLLEKIGKAKLLFMHILNALLISGIGIIETIYLNKELTGKDSPPHPTPTPEPGALSLNYLPRLIVVTACCWLIVASYIAQFIYVLIQ
ncbi:hypothetical protein Mgra_00007262 [Meloidogyne graminicola]|uniref:Cytochrome b561 domain-containing protein n=1 Tax=Meloidogyne graminicola TaxID=189291 RepID=A0A8S9ZJ75_9BILA|nr:hypothetical protein Mgra_00007262 [Meloidogyne graminicola]